MAQKHIQTEDLTQPNWWSSILEKGPLPWLFILPIVYGFASLFGYGNDLDTYLLLGSGHDFFRGLGYHTSRFQGSLIPELFIGGASLLGGSILSNLLSAILGSATLYFFYRILIPYLDVQLAILIVAIVGFNPFYIIVSSTSHDHIYALFFLILGFFLMMESKFFWGAVILAGALSSRITMGPLIALFYIHFLYECKHLERRQLLMVVLSGMLFTAVSILLFVPAYVGHNYSFRFLNYALVSWDWWQHLSRFIYKNIYLVSLPATLLMIGVFLKNLLVSREKFRIAGVAWLAMGILLVQELIFLNFPYEIPYQLPVLFVLLPLFSLQRHAKVYLKWLLLLTLVYNFVNVDILEIEYRVSPESVEAISAKPGVYIEFGPLITDLKGRSEAEQMFFKRFGLKD